MHKGVIIVQKPNKTMPEEYLKIAAGERDTYMGCVIPTLKGGLMHAAIPASQDDGAYPPDELVQIVKDTDVQLKTEDDTTDSPAVYYLAATDSTKTDDQQPFVILRDGSNQPQ